MAYIKTLKDNELIGGQDSTDVYPISTTQAIYSQDEEGNIRMKDNMPEKLEDRLSEMQEQIDSIDYSIDTVPTANSNNLVKSGGVKSALDDLDSAKQDTIQDLDTIRSNAQTGSISIQNIKNLMTACNEVFRIGFIGYHIEMNDEPDAQGDYTFNVVMNE